MRGITTAEMMKSSLEPTSDDRRASVRAQKSRRVRRVHTQWSLEHAGVVGQRHVNIVVPCHSPFERWYIQDRLHMGLVDEAWAVISIGEALNSLVIVVASL